MTKEIFIPLSRARACVRVRVRVRERVALCLQRSERTVHTAATATHFQQPHKQRSVGGPPRPPITKKNWMAAAMKNFHEKMRMFGIPGGR